VLFLTKQERQVLICIAAVLLGGVSVQYLAKKWTPLYRLISHIDSGKIYYKVDINRATYDELLRIPYIGDKTAQEIIRRREEKGRFKDFEELLTVKGIKEKNFQKFSPYLTIKN